MWSNSRSPPPSTKGPRSRLEQATQNHQGVVNVHCAEATPSERFRGAARHSQHLDGNAVIDIGGNVSQVVP